MEKRKIGNSDLETYPIIFGGNVFGWTIDEKTSFGILDAFVDHGFNMIDTADVYSVWAPGNHGGESETIIGQWIKNKGNRDKVVIATKVGYAMSPEKKGLSAKYILQEVEESLKRLQTGYIDLYQTHADDLETPIEETLEAYATLIKQGKVRVIGTSNMKADRITQSLECSAKLAIPAYQSIQPEYNLYSRQQYETELEPLAKEKNIGVITYFSLASGFLSGKYRSEEDFTKSKRGGGIKKYFTERGFSILKALDEVANKHSSDPASVSLAWLIARPGITAPIASATSIDQLHALTRSIDIRLDAEDVEKLDMASKY